MKLYCDDVLLDQSTSCCASRIDNSPNKEALSLSCFTTLDDPPTEGCVDPLPFFDTAPSSTGAGYRRCDAPIDCGESHICARLRPDQHLMRMTLYIPLWMHPGKVRDGEHSSTEKVVVWNGPKAEVLEASTFQYGLQVYRFANDPEVTVSRWLPRTPYLPISLPLLFERFFS